MIDARRAGSGRIGSNSSAAAQDRVPSRRAGHCSHASSSRHMRTVRPTDGRGALMALPVTEWRSSVPCGGPGWAPMGRKACARVDRADREAAVAEQNLEPTSPIGTYPGLVWSRARKMRENESDSGDGWRGPHDYISPWAARDPGGTDQAPAADPDLSPESGRQDTIAFGGLADEAGGPGQGSYVQRGYGDPWYGSNRDEPGYGSYAGPGGQYGSGSGGYGPGGSEG